MGLRIERGPTWEEDWINSPENKISLYYDLEEELEERYLSVIGINSFVSRQYGNQIDNE